jgi:hypothetical protein
VSLFPIPLSLFSPLIFSRTPPLLLSLSPLPFFPSRSAARLPSLLPFHLLLFVSITHAPEIYSEAVRETMPREREPERWIRATREAGREIRGLILTGSAPVEPKEKISGDFQPDFPMGFRWVVDGCGIWLNQRQFRRLKAHSGI